jgi:hypothetical protein
MLTFLQAFALLGSTIPCMYFQTKCMMQVECYKSQNNGYQDLPSCSHRICLCLVGSRLKSQSFTRSIGGLIHELEILFYPYFSPSITIFVSTNCLDTYFIIYKKLHYTSEFSMGQINMHIDYF